MGLRRRADILRVRSSARALRQALVREVAHLDNGRSLDVAKEIHDWVYLPRLLALAEELKARAHSMRYGGLCVSHFTPIWQPLNCGLWPNS